MKRGKSPGKSILKSNKSYTFADYFELTNPTKDVVAEFGYQYKQQQLALPSAPIQAHLLDALKENFYRKLPHISLTSEMAKREFIIGPMLLALLDMIDIEIDSEYPLDISELLKGNIDYWIRSSHNFIIAEAKNADLERGFTQLAVELIAVDKHMEARDDTAPQIYGAVTVGDVWRFGMLDRVQKIVVKDIDAYLVPASLESLFAVFLGILGNLPALQPKVTGASQ